MNTNREVIFSLVGLLVKKAGFDVNKNEAEVELNKTKETLEKLSKEKTTLNDKKNVNTLIENLKVRKAFWENNAEVIGRSLLEAYNEGENYNHVKNKIEALAALATEGTKNLEFGYTYSRSIELERQLKEIEEKVNNSDYINHDEKEMDEKYKSYLENKIKTLDEELSSIEKELDNLRDIETKDVNIVNKIRDYNESLSNNLNKLKEVSNSTIHTDIAFDIWEKLETTKSDLEEKLEKSVDALEKTESLLSEVRKNRMSLNNRKDVLSAERTRCSSKLTSISKSLEKDDYVNVTEKIMDLSNLEMVRLELESLKNKKEVIYVDANKVKEELIKEWENAPKDRSQKIIINSVEEASTSKEKDNKVEEESLNMTSNVKIEDDTDKTQQIQITKKSKFDLEW